jgi:hypothetical protein
MAFLKQILQRILKISIFMVKITRLLLFLMDFVKLFTSMNGNGQLQNRIRQKVMDPCGSTTLYKSNTILIENFSINLHAKLKIQQNQ